MNFGIKVVLLSASVLETQLAAETCESLARLRLRDATIITLAQQVSAGAFKPPKIPVPFPPAGRRGGSLSVVAPADLPEFCRIGGVIAPTPDSQIKFEVWMPASNWNGRFVGVGNGAFAGYINYPVMTSPLSRGFAVASTDTGHEAAATDASFALGHPEKLIDYAYRAVHEVTMASKQVIAAYYGGAPKYSYWDGCSNGGRQGFVEAQRFPDDFNGIIAGSSGNRLVRISASQIFRRQALDRNPEGLVTPSKLEMLHNAVVAACDALDGVKDGVLEDPRRCHFDPGQLECKGTGGPDCLTPAQVKMVRLFYNPVVNPRTKELIFPGFMPGSEVLWGDPAATGHMVAEDRPFSSLFRYALFQDPNWDYMTFNFDSDMARAEGLAAELDVTSPDLRTFFRRGGKVLQYHGWEDPAVSPLSAVDFYTSVLRFMGGAGKVQNSYRLFMVPGFGHCRGGDGPNTFDPLIALQEWVEKGKAPDQITASRWKNGKVDRTRPLCPYPQVAKYKGTGSTDDATNFTCVLPNRLLTRAAQNRRREQ